MGADLKDGKWVYDNMQIGLVNSTFKTLICTNVVEDLLKNLIPRSKINPEINLLWLYSKGRALEDCVETFLTMLFKGSIVP